MTVHSIVNGGSPQVQQTQSAPIILGKQSPSNFGIIMNNNTVIVNGSQQSSGSNISIPPPVPGGGPPPSSLILNNSTKNSPSSPSPILLSSSSSSQLQQSSTPIVSLHNNNNNNNANSSSLPPNGLQSMSVLSGKPLGLVPPQTSVSNLNYSNAQQQPTFINAAGQGIHIVNMRGGGGQGGLGPKNLVPRMVLGTTRPGQSSVYVIDSEFSDLLKTKSNCTTTPIPSSPEKKVPDFVDSDYYAPPCSSKESSSSIPPEPHIISYNINNSNSKSYIPSSSPYKVQTSSPSSSSTTNISTIESLQPHNSNNSSNNNPLLSSYSQLTHKIPQNYNSSSESVINTNNNSTTTTALVEPFSTRASTHNNNNNTSNSQNYIEPFSTRTSTQSSNNNNNSININTSSPQNYIEPFSTRASYQTSNNNNSINNNTSSSQSYIEPFVESSGIKIEEEEEDPDFEHSDIILFPIMMMGEKSSKSGSKNNRRNDGRGEIPTSSGSEEMIEVGGVDPVESESLVGSSTSTLELISSGSGSEAGNCFREEKRSGEDVPHSSSESDDVEIVYIKSAEPVPQYVPSSNSNNGAGPSHNFSTDPSSSGAPYQVSSHRYLPPEPSSSVPTNYIRSHSPIVNTAVFTPQELSSHSGPYSPSLTRENMSRTHHALSYYPSSSYSNTNPNISSNQSSTNALHYRETIGPSSSSSSAQYPNVPTTTTNNNNSPSLYFTNDPRLFSQFIEYAETHPLTPQVSPGKNRHMSLNVKKSTPTQPQIPSPSHHQSYLIPHQGSSYYNPQMRSSNNASRLMNSSPQSSYRAPPHENSPQSQFQSRSQSQLSPNSQDMSYQLLFGGPPAPRPTHQYETTPIPIKYPHLQPRPSQLNVQMKNDFAQRSPSYYNYGNRTGGPSAQQFIQRGHGPNYGNSSYMESRRFGAYGQPLPSGPKPRPMIAQPPFQFAQHYAPPPEHSNSKGYSNYAPVPVRSSTTTHSPHNYNSSSQTHSQVLMHARNNSPSGYYTQESPGHNVVGPPVVCRVSPIRTRLDIGHPISPNSYHSSNAPMYSSSSSTNSRQNLIPHNNPNSTSIIHNNPNSSMAQVGYGAGEREESSWAEMSSNNEWRVRSSSSMSSSTSSSTNRPNTPLTLQALPGLTAGAQAHHLLVKMENGQFQLVRVGSVSTPTTSSPNSTPTTTIGGQNSPLSSTTPTLISNKVTPLSSLSSTPISSAVKTETSAPISSPTSNLSSSNKMVTAVKSVPKVPKGRKSKIIVKQELISSPSPSPIPTPSNIPSSSSDSVSSSSSSPLSQIHPLTNVSFESPMPISSGVQAGPVSSIQSSLPKAPPPTPPSSVPNAASNTLMSGMGSPMTMGQQQVMLSQNSPQSQHHQTYLPISHLSTSPSNATATTVSQMTPDTAKQKCKNFLTFLMELSAKQNQTVARNVKGLIQGLIDGRVNAEDFSDRLQKEVNSQPQPCLVGFLKKSLPPLRHSLASKELTIDGIKPPPLSTLNLINNVPTPPPPVSALIPTQPKVRQNLSSVPNVPTTPVRIITPVNTYPPPNTVPLPISNINVNNSSMNSNLNPPNLSNNLQVQGPGVRNASPIPRSTVTAVQQRFSSPTTKGTTPKISKAAAAKAERAEAMASASAASFSSPKSTSKGKEKVDKKSFASSAVYGGDDDINDVAAMGGVNLAEESQRILGSTEMIGTQIRSCRDEPYLPGLSLQNKLRAICARHGLEEPPPEVATLISHAAEEKLKTMLEKLSVIAEHRLDVIKLDERYDVAQDVKGQLRFLEDLDKLERKRHDEQEREMLIKAAKSRSKSEDPEQAKLKAKAKEMQRVAQEEMRQRDANLTALQAIGPRKKPKLDEPSGSQSTTAQTPLSGLGALSSASRPQIPMRPRLKRVSMRDMMFLLESEKDTMRSQYLYKQLLK